MNQSLLQLAKQYNKKAASRTAKILHGWSLQKPRDLIGWLHENSCFPETNFSYSQDQTDKVTGVSFMYLQYRKSYSFWDIWKNFAWISIRNNYWNITDTEPSHIKIFLKHSEQKSIIFSDISMARIGKNMSIALQNMTESQKKNQLNMSKHSKKFSFRLEKCNNT